MNIFGLNHFLNLKYLIRDKFVIQSLSAFSSLLFCLLNKRKKIVIMFAKDNATTSNFFKENCRQAQINCKNFVLHSELLLKLQDSKTPLLSTLFYLTNLE
jgi:hypothetical protein